MSLWTYFGKMGKNSSAYITSHHDLAIIGLGMGWITERSTNFRIELETWQPLRFIHPSIPTSKMENEQDDRNNERIVDLTTAQKVTNDHLDQIDETVDALDRTIRGDYENNRSGLVARLETLEHEVAMHKAVLFTDATGKKGLIDTVDALVSGKMDAVERRKNSVSIIIAIITSTALVLTNLDRIGNFWTHLFKPKKVDVKHIKRKPVTVYVEPDE